MSFAGFTYAVVECRYSGNRTLLMSLLVAVEDIPTVFSALVKEVIVMILLTMVVEWVVVAIS